MNTSRKSLSSLMPDYKYVPGVHKRKQHHVRHGDAVIRREKFFSFMDRENIDSAFVNRVADFLRVSDSTGKSYYRLWKLAKKMIAAGDTVPEIAMACGVSEETIEKMKARYENENVEFGI